MSKAGSIEIGRLTISINHRPEREQPQQANASDGVDKPFAWKGIIGLQPARLAFGGFAFMFKKIEETIDIQFRHKELSRQIEQYVDHRSTLGVEHDRDVLREFMRFVKGSNISHVRKADINEFRNHVLATRTPYAATSAMRAIRCLLRYYRVKKVPCMDPSCVTDTGVSVDFIENISMLVDDMKKFSTRPKPVRNKDLVLKRIADREKWTWTELGNHFGINRESAYRVFRHHASKYIDPEILARYQKDLDKTYAKA